MYLRQIAKLAALSFAFVAAASPCHAQDVVTITGERASYRIPQSFVKSVPAGRYGDHSRFDNSPMLSLNIALSETSFTPEKSDDELSVRLYLDKRYDVETIWRSARYRVKDPAAVTQRGSYFVLDSSGKGYRQAFYMSFDPATDLAQMNRDSFTVFVSQNAPWTLGGKTITPRGSCEVSTTRDGILVHVSIVGSYCAPDEFQRLIDSFDRLLERWRVR